MQIGEKHRFGNSSVTCQILACAKRDLGKFAITAPRVTGLILFFKWFAILFLLFL